MCLSFLLRPMPAALGDWLSVRHSGRKKLVDGRPSPTMTA
jgi:hypothetical protein